MAKQPKPKDEPIPGAETRPAEGEQTRGAETPKVGDAGAETEPKGDGAKPEPEQKAKPEKKTERRVEPGSQVEFRVVSQFIEDGRLYQKDEGCMLTPERARQLGKGLVEPFPV